MKKLISLLLLAAMLVSAAACAEQKTDDGEADITVAQDSDTEPEETLSPREIIGAPADVNYDGHTFMIYSLDNSAYKIEHYSEGITGELVNDAVYNRNSYVSDMLNIKVTAEINVWDNDLFRTAVRTSVLARDEAYDMFTGNSYNMTALSAEGNFFNVNKVGTIHLNQPWWNKEANDALSVGDKMYLLYGDISMSNYGRYQCYFFNKAYINDYKFENPYDVFAKDEWTLDKLISMTKDFFVDVDGNDKQDETDIYGEYSPLQSVYNISNNWIRITEKNEENYPEVAFYSERTQQMFDTLRTYFKESRGVYAPMGWSDSDLFANGNSVFFYDCLKDAVYLREMEGDYGILPIPKYDEYQEGYQTVLDGAIVSIPVTASDPERTGMVMEALAYYGRELVYPAYVEQTITVKGTRDDEAAECIKIILDSGHNDFGVAFSGFDGYGYGLLEYIKTSKGFASFYEGYEKKATKELIDYADQILALTD